MRAAAPLLAIALLAIGVGLALTSGCGAPEAHPIRNAILVSLDTLRADHLGSYGYQRDTSPQLDALARDGVLFERAIAQAASTRRSHMALFQSSTAPRRGRGRALLAQVLADAGFRTAAFTGGGNISARSGFRPGFDLYLEDDGGLAESLPRLEKWLRARGEKRFFAFLHTYDVHLPYNPPEPYASMFFPEYTGRVAGPNTTELLRKYDRRKGHRKLEEEVVLSEADQRQFVALYDGGIRYTDSQVGRLLEILADLELLESTVLVLLSDHGEEFWDHGEAIHSHSVYQELIHVPLLWRLPGRRFAGTRVEAMVPLYDVAPTLLELLGVEAPPSFQGTSLLPLMRDGSGPPRAVVSETRSKQARIEYPWKLIAKLSAHRQQLFDLERDPREQHDLSQVHPARVAELQEALSRMIDGGAEVEVLAPDALDDPGQAERLRALGYVD